MEARYFDSVLYFTFVKIVVRYQCQRNSTVLLFDSSLARSHLDLTGNQTKITPFWASSVILLCAGTVLESCWRRTRTALCSSPTRLMAERWYWVGGHSCLPQMFTECVYVQSFRSRMWFAGLELEAARVASSFAWRGWDVAVVSGLFQGRNAAKYELYCRGRTL